MPGKKKAWCGYCIIGALTNVCIAALTLAEARETFAAIAEHQEREHQMLK